nr:hypothetical protein [Pseudopedobacter sp.]
MKNIFLMLLILIWLALVIALTLSLTNISPGLIEKKYGFLIGIVLIAITGFIRQFWTQIKNKTNDRF